MVFDMRLNTDIHLAQTGTVTYRNYRRLGYDRLVRGVYGHHSPTTGLGEWETRRARFMTHV